MRSAWQSGQNKCAKKHCCRPVTHCWLLCNGRAVRHRESCYAHARDNGDGVGCGGCPERTKVLGTAGRMLPLLPVLLSGLL